MSSGIVQLVSIGAQDTFLTGNPEVSNVRLLVRSPPPVNPAPAVRTSPVPTAPMPERAADAVFPPVPPLATSNGDDKPEIVPPVIAIALAFCAAPILLLGAYDSNLSFPLFGSVQIPSLYLALVVFMIPITGNTINSIDVLNGVASGVVTIASFALAISLFIK